MKKITLLTLSIMFAFSVSAQLFNVGGFGVGYLYVGPKLGGNASFNSADASTGTEKTANYGYQIGGIAKFGITNKLSIQPELLYTSKGFGTNTTSLDMTTKTNYKYVGLPIVAKYAFLAISGVQIYGSGGFYTDVLTGVTSKIEFGTTDEGETFKYDDLTPFTRVDFGFSIGGGANIPLSNNDKLNIDLRASFGAVNTDKQGGTSSKNTSIQLSAVYLVDLTKWVSFKGKSIEDNDAYEENSAPAGGSKVD